VEITVKGGSIMIEWGTIFLTFTGIIYLILMCWMCYRIRISTEVSKMLIDEIKKEREEEASPYVVVDIKPKEQAPHVLEMYISNIGGGPAFNVKSNITPDIVYRKEPKIMFSELPVFKSITHLAPGEKIKFFFAAALEYMTNKDNPKEFDIEVSYTDILKKDHKQKYHINLTEKSALLFAEEKGINDLVQEMERLTREICWLRKNIEIAIEKDEKVKKQSIASLKGIYREMKK
jgi:hypothetical protein